MHPHTQTRAPHLTLRSALAWLCIVLLLVVGAAHLLHTHPAGDEAANCSLCAVAHLAVIQTPVVAATVLPQVFTQIRLPAETAPPPRSFPPSLYVRPPPALTPHA